jgi:FHA domain
MNGKIISGPAAVLIIALFFLPWIAVSCEGEVVGEFSGYNLAAGEAPDGAEDIFAGNEISGDPILFIVPLAGIVTLILLAITLWKRSFEINASWGQIIAVFIALLVLFLEWLQLRGEGSDIFQISAKSAVWGSLVCLVAIGIGAVFDLTRSRKRPFSTFTPTPKEKHPSPPTPIAAYQPSALQVKDDNYTILDEGLIGSDGGGMPIDAGATILDDDLVSSGVDMNETMLDDVLIDDVDEEGLFTVLGDDIEGFGADAATLDTPSASLPQPGQPDAFDLPPQSRSIEKTEILHFQPEIEAWLLIDPDGGKKEQFRLGASTSIGRDPSNDLVLDDTALSGIHARIFGENGRFFILDQNSTNGVFIFDTIQNQWEKQDQYELQDGTQIKLGRTILHFKRSN